MKANYRQHHEIDRAEWDEFVSRSPQGAIYSLSGCLDALAPGWSLLELRDDHGLVAGMPLHLKKKGGYTASIQPPFSQYWGIILTPEDHLSAYKEYREKNLQVKTLLEALPKIDWFGHGFAPSFDYPQPFHWQQYTLNTRYTWLLDLEKSEEELLQNMRKTTRNLVRNSPAKVTEAQHIEGLSQLLAENRQAGKELITEEEEDTLKKLAEWLFSSGLGWAMHAELDGKTVGIALFATFKDRTVYLMSAKMPGQDRVMSHLLWHSILKAKGTSRIFDFEGSMHEGIEQFFRGFGPRPTPYLYIEQNQIPQLLRWIKKSL